MSSKSKSKEQKKSRPERSEDHFVDVKEVWLICAPGDKTPRATWDAVNNATRSLCANFKFHIPDLKAGICICRGVILVGTIPLLVGV